MQLALSAVGAELPKRAGEEKAPKGTFTRASKAACMVCVHGTMYTRVMPGCLPGGVKLWMHDTTYQHGDNGDDTAFADTWCGKDGLKPASRKVVIRLWRVVRNTLRTRSILIRRLRALGKSAGRNTTTLNIIWRSGKPTATEVGMLWGCADGTEAPPPYNAIVFDKRGGKGRKVGHYNPMVYPLAYPIFFTDGSIGYVYKMFKVCSHCIACGRRHLCMTKCGT